MLGIRGLQTFLEQYTKYACYRKDIQTLVNDYTTRTGKTAKIVVDTLSCFPMWYEEWDWYVIYEVQEFIQRSRVFVEKFKKLGVELIFFFGGLNVETTRRTWLTIQRSRIANIHRAIDGLITFGRSSELDFKTPVPIPGLTTDYILKYVLGCEVLTTTKEFRQGVMEYAQEHQCFAIFTEDTDFVVSQVDAVILSAHNFEIDDMTTLVYDGVRLARKLGIRTEELPLLAILAGNEDLIQFVEIQNFHRRLCPGLGLEIPIHILLSAIARHINKLPKDETIEETLKRLARDLFDDSSQAGLLRRSYNSYFVAKNSESSVWTPADERSKILRAVRFRYQNGLLPFHVYSVLSDRILLYGPSFENVRIGRSDDVLTRDLPSSTVLRTLRLRLYGILLLGKGAEDSCAPVTVQEWCHENIYSYHESVIVNPVKPAVHHPGLLALWSDDDDINELRWSLFLTTISPSLETAQWRSFDDGFLFSTLTAYHLYDIEYLNESELDAVLATIANFPLYDAERLFSLEYGEYDVRFANIIVTMNRTFGLVLTVLAACGYPVKLSQNNAYIKFEVKVFQKKYVDVMQKKADVKTLCENNDECLKLFEQMKELIIGTHRGRQN